MLAGEAAAHEGAVHEITGPESLSYADLAAAISRATARRVRYAAVPRAAFGIASRAARVPAWQRDVAAGLYAAIRAGYLDVVTDVVERVGGKAPESFGRFAREHAAAFGVVAASAGRAATRPVRGTVS